MKIKFRLIKAYKMLLFDIQEQDMSWNQKCSFKATNGVNIRTDNPYPYISNIKGDSGNVRRISHNSDVFVRGTMRDGDALMKEYYENKLTTVHFVSNEDRDFWYDKILEAIEEWTKVKKE